MRLTQRLAAILMLAFIGIGPAMAAPHPIEVRVVVVTTWEYEPDGKDLFGELHAWRELWPLGTSLPFPAGNHDLRYDPKSHVLAVVTGMTTSRAAASIMALGLDPRFDLSHAYWIVAGTAGIDPKIGSIGSVAWARWVIDGDIGLEIDLRDAPSGWSTGLIPHRRTEPFQTPAPPNQLPEGNMAFPLDAALVDWALGLTRDIALADGPKLAEQRALYSGEAARPPFVLEGDVLTSVRFWYGRQLNDRAERWVDYWTGGKGVFTMSAEEDSGILQAMSQLAGAGRMKLDRVLVLRASDGYTVAPAGVTAIDVLVGESKTGPPGVPQALENLYRVASPVARYLVGHWASVRDAPPGK